MPEFHSNEGHLPKIPRALGNYNLSPGPDPILGQATLINNDHKPGKINLAIGYLCGEDGKIWRPSAIEKAATRVPSSHQEGYLIPFEPEEWNGIPEYMMGAARIVFGEYADILLTQHRIAAASTVGGTQAVALFAEAVKRTKLGTARTPTIIMGDPPYPNHPKIFAKRDLPIQLYPHLTSEGNFNMDATLQAIQHANENMVIVLQPVHNPTGQNATTEDQVRKMAQAATNSGVVCLFDVPYSGIGKDIYEDTKQIRTFMEAGAKIAVAISFSKTADLYDERVGGVYIPYATADDALRTTRLFNDIIRAENSSPPAHGQRIMREVFTDNTLYTEWTKQNLPAMAGQLRTRRAILADYIGGDEGENIRRGVGIFTVLPVTNKGADNLQSEHIYVVKTDLKTIRVNIGGVTTQEMEQATQLISSTLRRFHS